MRPEEGVENIRKWAIRMRNRLSVKIVCGRIDKKIDWLTYEGCTEELPPRLSRDRLLQLPGQGIDLIEYGAHRPSDLIAVDLVQHSYGGVVLETVTI